MKEYKFKINGNEYVVSVNDIDETNVEATVNGKPFKIEIDKPVKRQNPAVAPTKPAVQTSSVVKPAAAATNQVTLTSPLPGVILEIAAKIGDKVKVGQTVMVLEAMKMENAVEANAEGTIISISVNVGDSVLEGAPLAIIG
jgi:Acetyl/propionyl-CoA carboxylase, alpha subunit